MAGNKPRPNNPRQTVPPIDNRTGGGRAPHIDPSIRADHQPAAEPEPKPEQISFEQHAFRQAVEKAIIGFADCLQLAQAGEIVAYAVLCVGPGGQVTWKWHFGTRTQAEMIGAANCMAWAMTNFVLTGTMPVAEPVHPPGNA